MSGPGWRAKLCRSSATVLSMDQIIYFIEVRSVQAGQLLFGYFWSKVKKTVDSRFCCVTEICPQRSKWLVPFSCKESSRSTISSFREISRFCKDWIFWIKSRVGGSFPSNFLHRCMFKGLCSSVCNDFTLDFSCNKSIWKLIYKLLVDWY